MVIKLPESIIDLYLYGDIHGNFNVIKYDVRRYNITNAVIILCGDVG